MARDDQEGYGGVLENLFLLQVVEPQDVEGCTVSRKKGLRCFVRRFEKGIYTEKLTIVSAAHWAWLSAR